MTPTQQEALWTFHSGDLIQKLSSHACWHSDRTVLVTTLDHESKGSNTGMWFYYCELDGTLSDCGLYGNITVS